MLAAMMYALHSMTRAPGNDTLLHVLQHVMALAPANNANFIMHAELASSLAHYRVRTCIKGTGVRALNKRQVSGACPA
jgi:hypothetical protein